jgi:hypothetical protein
VKFVGCVQLSVSAAPGFSRVVARSNFLCSFDYFPPWNYPDDKTIQSGQNRLMTVFFYLNNVTSGGETLFPLSDSVPEDQVFQLFFDIRVRSPLTSKIFLILCVFCLGSLNL